MCHNPNYDLESYEKSLIEHLNKEFTTPTYEDAVKFKPIYNELMKYDKIEQIEIHKLLAKNKLAKYIKNSFLIQSLYLLIEKGEIDEKQEDHLINLLKIKRCKSHSGILSITVFTSPYPTYTDKEGNLKTQMFTCNHNCHYCPNEPGQPRSYLKGEPGVLRANRYGFDACNQVWGRLMSLYSIGHKVKGSKIELLILGGTWTSYPVEYREEFIRDIYYAANTLFDKEKREKLDLKSEQNLNQDTLCRIIGLTVEFRPDSITKQELYRLRSYGCTRVQLGVQHLDNNILKKINRQCTTERFKKSLKLLKNCGYKVDIHIMPNLPFSTPEIDRKMLLDDFLGLKSEIKYYQKDDIEYEEYELNEPDISADQWKIYPCETVPYTEIEKWYREGTYKPYDKNELYNLIYDTKKKCFPFIRTNRIIRDISKPYIIASSNEPNTGQIILDDLKKNGDHCKCIRCREVKEKEWDGNYMIVIRHYKASDGDEYFISAESKDKTTLYGFTRLRLCSPEIDIFPELEGCGLIRELHVYGVMNPVKENSNIIQHKGIGRKLISIAERIAKDNGYSGMSIIAGIGVKRYYEKLGYINDNGRGDFMKKNLS